MGDPSGMYPTDLGYDPVCPPGWTTIRDVNWTVRDPSDCMAWDIGCDPLQKIRCVDSMVPGMELRPNEAWDFYQSAYGLTGMAVGAGSFRSPNKSEIIGAGILGLTAWAIYEALKAPPDTQPIGRERVGAVPTLIPAIRDYLQTLEAPQPQGTMVPPILPTKVATTPIPTQPCTPTPTQENCSLVVDLGPGMNYREIENILFARPNQKVIAIEADLDKAAYLDIILNSRYSTDRLEIIAGSFGNATILNGRSAIEMFSIYPDSAAIGINPGSGSIKLAVDHHLAQDGYFYAVTEQQPALQTIAVALSQTIGFGYVHLEGVPTSDIKTGRNGPGIPFDSPSFQDMSRVYDLWGRKQ